MTEGRRYRIHSVLGKGGFGTVYRADMLGDGGFTKKVALKVLNADMAGMEDVAHRLRDEARLLGILRHRAIVQVDGLVLLENRWTVIMEYIEGTDLQRLLRSTGPIPLGCALEMISEVASALDVAYATAGPDGIPLQLLHRDIKPPNILLTTAGEIKVLDFGIARAEFIGREAKTKSVLYGSVGYMAPERMEFEELPAGDVYALGVVLYELLNGASIGKYSISPQKHAVIINDALDLLWKKLPTSPPEFRELLSSMLSYEPGDRPSAREVERRCRALRNEFREPWLRDWAEQTVPMAMGAAKEEIESELTGSILVERSGAIPNPPPTSQPVLKRPASPKTVGGTSLSWLWGCGVLVAFLLICSLLVTSALMTAVLFIPTDEVAEAIPTNDVVDTSDTPFVASSSSGIASNQWRPQSQANSLVGMPEGSRALWDDVGGLPRLVNIQGQEAVIGRFRIFPTDDLYYIATAVASEKVLYTIGPLGTYGEGYRAAHASIVGNSLAVSNASAKLRLFDLQTGQERQLLTFTDQVKVLCNTKDLFYLQLKDERQFSVDPASGQLIEAKIPFKCNDYQNGPFGRLTDIEAESRKKAPHIQGFEVSGVYESGSRMVIRGHKSPGTEVPQAVGFNAKTAQILWKIDVPNFDPLRVREGSDRYAALIDNRYYTVYGEGDKTWHLAAFDADNGARLWDIQMRAIFAVDDLGGLVASQKYVYVVRMSSLEIYDAKSGKLLTTLGSDTYE